jgi:hypothetical protein
MNKYLFLLASAGSLAIVHLASAQYLPPTLGGTAIGPGYTAPGYAPPTYTAPGYGAPASPTPGYTAPGYNWREQRANEDWRNNTWREQRANEDWRTNNWRQQRANEDWRQREEIAKQRNPNNVIDRGYVEPDQAAKAAAEAKKKALEKKEECDLGTMKSSPLCQDREKDKTKNTAADTTKKGDTSRGSGSK